MIKTAISTRVMINIDPYIDLTDTRTKPIRLMMIYMIKEIILHFFAFFSESGLYLFFTGEKAYTGINERSKTDDMI